MKYMGQQTIFKFGHNKHIRFSSLDQGCKKSKKKLDGTSKTGLFFENLQKDTKVNKNTRNKVKTLRIRHKNVFPVDKTLLSSKNWLIVIMFVRYV